MSTGTHGSVATHSDAHTPAQFDKSPLVPPPDVPFGFASPVAEPLANEPAPPHVSVPDAIPAPDQLIPPSSAGPALDTVSPTSRSPRDPRRPFDANLAGTGSKRMSDPRSPIRLDGMLPPAAPAFAGPAVNNNAAVIQAPPPSANGRIAAPGPAQTAGRPANSTTMRQALAGTGIMALVILAVGALFQNLSVTAFVVAWLCTMNFRVGRRKTQIAFGIGVALGVVAILVEASNGYFATLPALTPWMRWVDLALIPTIVACVYSSLPRSADGRPPVGV